MFSALSGAVTRHFTCDVCRLKMSFNSRDAHLAGRKHTKKLRADGVVPSAIPVTSSQIPLSTIATSSPSPDSLMISAHIFRCAVCAIDMTIGSKTAHLVGKKHAQKLAAKTAVLPPTAAPTPSQLTPARNTSTAPTLIKLFKCTTCCISIQIANKDTHLAGRRHQENLAKQATGEGTSKTAAGPAYTRKRTGGKSRRPPPSPGPSSPGSSDDGYFSQEEGLALLRDIDTQWGAMPWGGAYKESNHYYGPGIYDYY